MSSYVTLVKVGAIQLSSFLHSLMCHVNDALVLTARSYKQILSDILNQGLLTNHWVSSDYLVAPECWERSSPASS